MVFLGVDGGSAPLRMFYWRYEKFFALPGIEGYFLWIYCIKLAVTILYYTSIAYHAVCLDYTLKELVFDYNLN